ncbi:16278_t:CDS:1, partial [Acaulospora colombiana]
MAHIRTHKNPVLIKVKSETLINDQEALQGIARYTASEAVKSLPQKKFDDIYRLKEHLSTRDNKRKAVTRFFPGIISDIENRKRTYDLEGDGNYEE